MRGREGEGKEEERGEYEIEGMGEGREGKWEVGKKLEKLTFI